MKKLFCILFAATLLMAAVFADKSKFYENGKVIGTMYVEPPEGLRVRSQPAFLQKNLQRFLIGLG